MVWNVCLRVLGDAHEAEDAFQATFLILSRRSDSPPLGDSLGPWLRGVARRVARRARDGARRRRPAGALDAVRDAGGAEDAAALGELRAAVREEVGRLQPEHRAAVELCHLGSLPLEEAASRLGCPVGTVKSRLARGRERLRGSLARRGLAPAAVAAASGRAEAAVPPALAWGTVRAMTESAAGVTGAFPGPVAALARGAMRAMLLKQLMLTAVLAVGTAATATGVYAFQDGELGPPRAKPGGTLPVSEEAAPVLVGRPASSGEDRSDGPAHPTAHAQPAVVGDTPAPREPAASRAWELARTARGLHEEKRHAEEAVAVRELAAAVAEWERDLRKLNGFTYAPATSRAPAGVDEAPVPALYAPQSTPLPAPKPIASARPASPGDVAGPANGPPAAGSDQERRLRRVEQLLEELLRRSPAPPPGANNPGR